MYVGVYMHMVTDCTTKSPWWEQSILLWVGYEDWPGIIGVGGNKIKGPMHALQVNRNPTSFLDFMSPTYIYT